MKKKLLLFIMICVTVLCSACTRRIMWYMINDDSSDKTEINVVVSGVDGGIMSGPYACEWNGKYAYYDNGVIYYFENEDAEAKTVKFFKPLQMVMNEEYIYLAAPNGICAVDLKTMKKNVIVESKYYTILGVNVYPDGVFVRLEGLLAGNIFDVSKLELDCVSKTHSQFMENTTHFVGEYGQECLDFQYFINGKLFEVNTSYSYPGSNQTENLHMVLSVEHVVEYDGRLYILFQQYHGIRELIENNVKYENKVSDHLVCVNPETKTSESIYQTAGPQEQIVNFSIENNEMYLLADGILYKANLVGGQRVELADYAGEDTLYFDYANDTLFVYDGDKLLGQYK